MDNTDQKATAKGTPVGETAQDSASAAPQVAVTARWSGAVTELGRSLYQAAIDSNQQLTEAAESFAKSKAGIEQETSGRANEAYAEYVRAAQAVAGKEGGQQLLTEAYANYAATVNGLSQDACRRLQDLYQTFAVKQSEVAEVARKGARNPYVDYLKEVQRIWGGLDVEKLLD